MNSIEHLLQEKFNYRSGEIILIDKPYTWTSFQAVAKLKYALKKHISLFEDNKYIQLKIGHAGTLDPLATGLLVVCTGKKTKEVERIQAQEKEYTGTFFLGASTPCFDREKEPDQFYPINHIDEARIETVAKQFVGIQDQVPPQFSAVKVDGKRAYSMARKGEEVIIRPKQIEIKSFQITRIALPLIDFKITCSKGTYIRSIARDFGLALESGAYLHDLRRERIGEYKIAEAIKL